MLPHQLDQVNKSLCAPFNRKGFLCSECKEKYGLAAYHYYGLMCVKCSNSAGKWIGFILLLFTPPTMCFLVMLILDINVHSERLTGFIYFSQMIITTTFFFPSLIILPQHLFGYWPLQILLGLYGVWSLNFMQLMVPPFRISTNLSTLQMLSLSYVSSVYPLVLCVITYYLIEFHAQGNWLLVKVWKPFKRFFYNRDLSINSSVIHAFGTFLVFSYGKNVFVSFALVQSYQMTELDIATNTMKSLPPRSVDLGVPYFGATHAPYAVLGLFGGITTIILPLVLVLIYPTRVFTKLIGCCGLRRWHMIRTFMEVFVGSYKDGTEGSRDYRLTAGLYLIGRIMVGVAWSIGICCINSVRVQYYAWLWIAVPFVLFAVAFALFKPHRKWSHNLVDTLLFLLMAKICICFHIVFETATSEYSLRIMILLILVDIAIPQIVLLVHFGIKVVFWAHSQYFKFGNPLNVNYENGEDALQNFQRGTRESQPLLHSLSS